MRANFLRRWPGHCLLVDAFPEIYPIFPHSFPYGLYEPGDLSLGAVRAEAVEQSELVTLLPGINPKSHYCSS